MRGYECAASRPFTKRAVRAAVEGDAEVDQLADAGRALVDEHAHGVGIADSPAPAVSVSRMWSSAESSANMTPAMPPCA